MQLKQKKTKLVHKFSEWLSYIKIGEINKFGPSFLIQNFQKIQTFTK
jgi:hypothetical protein